MILSWKGKDGKRKGKSISTGLPVKGNKKRAEAMLLKTRKEFNPDNLMENADMLFTDFLSKWLKDKAVTLGTSTYAEYAYDVKNYIVPYFQEHPIALLKMTARDLENFYRHERQQNELQTSCCCTMRSSLRPFSMRSIWNGSGKTSWPRSIPARMKPRFCLRIFCWNGWI